MFRTLILLTATLAAILVLLGHAQAVHRSADTVAFGRPLFGAFCLLGVFAANSTWLRFTFGLIGLASLISVAALYVPQSPQQDLRVYSKNLWFSNAMAAELVADISKASVDVVFLQEVSIQNRKILDDLLPEFPHQHLCRFSDWSGIAVLSRTPFLEDGNCTDWRALAAVPIEVSGTRVWLVALHLPWPWPHDSALTDKISRDFVAQLSGPIVIGGDFNAFPWSGRIARIAQITDTMLAGPPRVTMTLRGVPLPIDMVLAPGGGQLEARPLFGSDHHGVVAMVGLEQR